jgi:predicted ArsR family transcriptional regulator
MAVACLARQQRPLKQTQLLAMLRRDEGASGPQIAEAMGRAPHTARGFLAGLAKKGIAVEALEPVRRVGPKKTGSQKQLQRLPTRPIAHGAA